MLSNRVILGIVVHVIVFGSGCDHEARDLRAKQMQTKSTANLVQSYADAVLQLARDCGTSKLDISHLPTALFSDPGLNGWNGPYIKGSHRVSDHWGTPIRFRLAGNRLYVASAGPDHSFDTVDDVCTEKMLPE